MKEVIQKIKSHKKEIIILIAAIVTIVGFLISDVRGVLKDYLEWQVEKKEIDFLFSMKQKCREEGIKVYQQAVKEVGKDKLCTPQYTYNKKLHTCIYYGCYIGDINTTTNRWVKNLLTNETIISYPSTNSPINTPPDCFFNNTLSELPLLSIEGQTTLYDCFLSEERFSKEKQKLFNQ